jgi:hypothetical protein
MQCLNSPCPSEYSRCCSSRVQTGSVQTGSDDYVAELTGLKFYESVHCCFKPCVYPFIVLRICFTSPIVIVVAFGYIPFLIVYYKCCCYGREEGRPQHDERNIRQIPRTSIKDVDSSEEESSHPGIPRRPSLKSHMLQFVDEHDCAHCDYVDSLAVRRQKDGMCRVRCRECHTYVSTSAVMQWALEEGEG